MCPSHVLQGGYADGERGFLVTGSTCQEALRGRAWEEGPARSSEILRVKDPKFGQGASESSDVRMLKDVQGCLR